MASGGCDSLDSGGYDYEFVPELPDDYICVICHLALKVPKQLEECGHRFCESCLNKMRTCSNPGNEMLCPIDRKAFRKEEIFKDRATERCILNWKVKCPEHENGCEWIGDLNIVENHIMDLHEKGSNDGSNEARDKRIEELELALAEKSSELLSLKETVEKLENDSFAKIKQLSEEFNKFKLEYSSKKEKIPIVDSEDPRSLKVMSNKYAWICPTLNCHDVDYYSPPIYYDGFCFQLSLLLNFDFMLEVSFYRCRGKFDHDVHFIKNLLPKGFECSVDLVDRRGNYDNLVFDKRKMVIGTGFERSLGDYNTFENAQKYLVKGYYHLELEFMKDE